MSAVPSNVDGGRKRLYAAAIAGLMPAFAAASDFGGSIMLAACFAAGFAFASASSLALPKKFSGGDSFSFGLLAASLGVAFALSAFRILAPLRFELLYTRAALIPFTIPVLEAAWRPEATQGTESRWDASSRALVLALTIIILGAGRELLANGSVSLALSGQATQAALPFMATPSAAFLLVGFGLAAWASVSKRLGKETL